MASHERHPMKAHLHGRCNVDGARRELAFGTKAETGGAVAGAGTGARRQEQKPGTKDEGKRWQQRFVDRKEKVNGESELIPSTRHRQDDSSSAAQ